jgi:hypothetical protein
LVANWSTKPAKALFSTLSWGSPAL